MNIQDMKILSIDDNKINLLIVEKYVKSLSLEIDSYTKPKKALKSLDKKNYDLIIVDYMMPQIDGLSFIKEVRKTNQDIPIIMITAAGQDMDLQLKALELGANDFLTKPINQGSFKARIQNILKLRKSQLLLQDKALLLQNEVDLATKKLITAEHESLQILAKCAEYKDPETGAHTMRVAHYSRILASLYGLDQKQQDIIFYASPFHDLGKIGIADKILLKPARLDEEEFSLMKLHTTIGYEILKDAKSKYLKAGAIIAQNHHEKYDGTGYPAGLKGENIPIFGRITAIVDVFDALTSKRPYKEAWSFEKSCETLVKDKNKHFDPLLVDLFIQNIHLFKNIYDRFQEE